MPPTEFVHFAAHRLVDISIELAAVAWLSRDVVFQ
jgi:hypothetical protein